MITGQKLGRAVGKVTPRTVLSKAGTIDFVSCVDGIAFGVDMGKSFHTATKEWKAEDQIRWARANGLFFAQIAKHCIDFANVVEREERKDGS